MKDHRRILGVSPEASLAEIEALINDRLEQCLGLVSHSDPEVARKANKYYQFLLEARQVLLTYPAEGDAAPVSDERVVAEPASSPVSSPLVDNGETSGKWEQVEQTQPLVIPAQSVPENGGHLAANPISVQTEAPAALPGGNGHLPSPQAPLADSPAPEHPTTEREGHCPACHFDNPAHARYCQHCNTQIGKECPSCLTVNRVNVHYCSQCGFDFRAYEIEQRKEKRLQQNRGRITELNEIIRREKANQEGWRDAQAGTHPKNSPDAARVYDRILSSHPVPNLWWLWIILAVLVAIFCGLVLRLPQDIALYIGLGCALPAGLAVLRAGAGCQVSLAVWVVGGGIAAAVVAWGSQFMIGILCGLLSLPIIYLLGNQISEAIQKSAVKDAVGAELAQTTARIQAAEAELASLTK